MAACEENLVPDAEVDVEEKHKDPAMSENECVKIEDLPSSLGSMIDAGRWTDVTFVFGSGDERSTLEAHKVILAARSPVFQAMFFGQLANNDPIEIEDIDAETFKLFLRFLYTDKAEFDETYVLLVLAAAHKYGVESAMVACDNIITEIMRIDNICDILETALFLQRNKLSQKAFNFIDDHAKEVLASPGFKTLTHSTMILVLKGDTLFVAESLVALAMKDWAIAECGRRKIDATGDNVRLCLGEAMETLRLQITTSNDLADHIIPTGILTSETIIRTFQFLSGSKSFDAQEHPPCLSRKPRRFKYTSFFPTDQKTPAKKATFIRTTVGVTCQEDINLVAVELAKHVQLDNKNGLKKSGIVIVSIPQTNSHSFVKSVTKQNVFSLEHPLFLKKGKKSYAILIEGYPDSFCEKYLEIPAFREKQEETDNLEVHCVTTSAQQSGVFAAQAASSFTFGSSLSYHGQRPAKYQQTEDDYTSEHIHQFKNLDDSRIVVSLHCEFVFGRQLQK